MNNLTIQNHMRVLSGQGSLQRPELPGMPRGGVVNNEEVKGPGFGETLAKAVDDLNTQLKGADKMAADLATGQSRDIHGTVIAVQQADVSFRMMLTVRNKVLKAYEEVMRMQA